MTPLFSHAAAVPARRSAKACFHSIKSHIRFTEAGIGLKLREWQTRGEACSFGPCQPRICAGKRNVRQGIAKRLLVLPLILAVFSLGAEAVSHSHGISHDEDHCTCQVCHVGHAALPQPTPQAEIVAPLLAERFAPVEAPFLVPESVDVASVPRAPPE